MIVTIEDIKNELDIDLVAIKGEKQAERWLQRCENEVLAFIASYSYGGMQKVNDYIEDSECKKIIRDAIIEQVDYLADNNFVEPENIIDTQRDYSSLQISKKVYNILLVNGLLYAGRC